MNTAPHESEPFNFAAFENIEALVESLGEYKDYQGHFNYTRPAESGMPEKKDMPGSLVNALRSDGALLVPSKFPEAFDEDFINEELPGMSVPEVSAHLMRRYIPREEVSDRELAEMMLAAHNFDIPLQNITGEDIVAWLDQGPTASFKDVAARAIAQLLEHWCEKNQTPKNIVVATSGDTGVAIADAFAGSKWVTVSVLYPTTGVSEVQEKQMLKAAENKNIQVIPISGNFDKCQDIAKTLLKLMELEESNTNHLIQVRRTVSEKLKQDISEAEAAHLIAECKKLNLFTANSINMWRLIPQMTQYFSAYAQMREKGDLKPGEKVAYAVPTGNVGHLMAGIYAMEMGLPVDQFIVGTNENNIVANFLNHGLIKHSGFKETDSPSMDILDPSNLERLLDYARMKADPSAVVDMAGIKRVIKEMEDAIKKLEPGEPMPEGVDVEKFGVTPKMLEFLRSFIYVKDTESREAMLDGIGIAHEKSEGKVVLESHGSAGYNAGRSARADGFIEPDKKIVYLETAHPDKFPDVQEMSGIETNRSHERLDELMDLDIADMNKPLPLELVGDVMNQVRKHVADQLA